MDRKFRSFVISPEGEVTLTFHQEIVTAGSKKPAKEEDSDDEDQTAVRKYSVTAPDKPHKDMFDCLTSLKKLGLDVCEIGINGKELATWGVTGVKIAGDMVMRKSRVQLRLTKYVKRTKKSIHLWSPQVTMYPDKEDAVKFESADKLSDGVESLLTEIEKFIDGKGQETAQLPLFATIELA